LNSAVAGGSNCATGNGWPPSVKSRKSRSLRKKNQHKNGEAFMVKKTISTLAFCADRAFGVCTNKHDDYRPKDN